MTLLLALSNESYAIVVGDRRLTSNGRVREDEANKLCILFCNDARIAIAFTGVAALNGFKTQDWLRDTLYELSDHHNTLDELLAAFQERASKTFSRFPVAARSIAFLITGFRYAPTRRKVCYLLSNISTSGAFLRSQGDLELHTLDSLEPVVVKAAGYTRALKQSDLTSLQRMLEADNSPPKVLRKAIQIVQRVARDSKSRRMIGSQCNSGVIPAQPNTVVVGTYHSVRPSFRAYAADVVHARSGGRSVVTGAFLQAASILAGPEIKKNDLCWCDSGKRFKNCHLKKFGSVYARIPGFRKPLYLTFAIESKTKHPSGKWFVVQSGFS